MARSCTSTIGVIGTALVALLTPLGCDEPVAGNTPRKQALASVTHDIFIPMPAS